VVLAEDQLKKRQRMIEMIGRITVVEVDDEWKMSQ